MSRFFDGKTFVFRFEAVPLDQGIDLAQRRNQEKVRGAQIRAEVQAELLHQGVQAPDVHLSLSNTHRLDECFITVVGSNYPVGIDLEDRDRAISEAAVRRFVDSSEASLNLLPVELWVLKEAAFKANPQNHGTVISQYRVIRWSETSQTGEVGFFVAGVQQSEFNVLLLFQDPWCLAVARI